MNLTWHIVRKDLYRLRWMLVLWVVTIAAGMAMATIQVGLDAITYQPFYMIASLIAFGLLPLIAFGLVMGLVHDDPVADDDAFWITRPISCGQLFTAKALALSQILLVPVAAAVPWWLNHGFDTSQLGQGAWQTLLTQWAFALVALPLAVVSPNGSRFVMNVILAAAGLIGLVLLYQLGNSRDQVSVELMRSRVWLLCGGWLVASLAIAVCQFFGRRTKRSLVVASLAVIVGFLVAKWWPWEVGPGAGRIQIVPSLATETLAPAAWDVAASLATPVPGRSPQVDGVSSRLELVAEVPLEPGRKSVRHGVTVRVVDVFANSLTGALEIALGESVPRATRSLPFAISRPEDATKAYYFLVNRTDGRSLPGQARRVGNTLDAFALRYSHLEVSFQPSQRWRGGPPPDFVAWSKQAVVVKVMADAAGHRSRDAMTQHAANGLRP